MVYHIVIFQVLTENFYDPTTTTKRKGVIFASFVNPVVLGIVVCVGMTYLGQKWLNMYD